MWLEWTASGKRAKSGPSAASLTWRPTRALCQLQPHSSPSPTMESDTELPLRSIYVTLVSVSSPSRASSSHSSSSSLRDAPLTSSALAQAKALATAFARTPIDAIYSSDIKRASQTAHELLEANTTIPPPPLVQTQSLREQATKANTPEGERIETAQQAKARLATSIRRFHFPRVESLRGKSMHAGPADAHVVVVTHEAAIAEVRRRRDGRETGVYAVSNSAMSLLTHTSDAPAQLLDIFMSNHDPGSAFGQPWPDPRKGHERVPMEHTAWSRLQVSVPSKEATPGCLSSANSGEGDAQGGESGGAESEQQQRPPRSDIFVRLVGPQNQSDHLRAFRPTSMMPSKPATQASTSRPALAAAPAPSRPTPSKPSQPYNQYSASFMSRAMAMGSRNGVGVRSDGFNGFQGDSSIDPSTSPGAGAGTQQSHRLIFPHPTATPSPAASAEGWQLIVSTIMPLFDAAAVAATNAFSSSTPSSAASFPSLPIEELNELVAQHIRRALERGPARASSSLSADLRALLVTGLSRVAVQPFNGNSSTNSNGAAASMSAAEEARTLHRLAAAWVVFFSSVLPWLKGVFLPLGTDPILLSLSSGGSGTASALGGGGSATSSATQLPPTPVGPHHPAGSSSMDSMHAVGGGGGAQLPSSATSSGLVSSFSSARLAPTSPLPNNAPLPGGATSPASNTSALPGSSNVNGNTSTGAMPSALRSQRIDVRRMALVAFRDCLVLPSFETLYGLLGKIHLLLGVDDNVPDKSYNSSTGTPRQGGGASRATPAPTAAAPADGDRASDTMRRLTQMTHILRSAHTGDEPQRAIDGLLRALRLGGSGTGVGGRGVSGGANMTNDSGATVTQGSVDYGSSIGSGGVSWSRPLNPTTPTSSGRAMASAALSSRSPVPPQMPSSASGRPLAGLPGDGAPGPSGAAAFGLGLTNGSMTSSSSGLGLGGLPTSMSFSTAAALPTRETERANRRGWAPPPRNVRQRAQSGDRIRRSYSEDEVARTVTERDHSESQSNGRSVDSRATAASTESGSGTIDGGPSLDDDADDGNEEQPRRRSNTGGSQGRASADGSAYNAGAVRLGLSEGEQGGNDDLSTPVQRQAATFPLPPAGG